MKRSFDRANFQPLPLGKESVVAALQGRFVEFYQAYTPLKQNGGEWRGPCPLHHGDGPNFAVDAETGRWYCHSQCQAGGDVFDFVQKRDGLDFSQALERVAAWAGVQPGLAPIPRRRTEPIRKDAPSPLAPHFLNAAVAQDCHDSLMSHDRMLDWLSKYRGLTPETLKRFQIGLQKTEGGVWRVTFPVYDAAGNLTNIRQHLFQYKSDLDRTYKTMPWEKGLQADLFPLFAIKDAQDVLLVEGEADAVLACQMEFAAISGTLGAGNWKPHWTEALRGKRRVTILYDNDQAGQEGGRKVAAALSGAVMEVRLAHLPDGQGKDLSEWVMQHEATAEDVQRVIDEATPFVPPLVDANEAEPLTQATPTLPVHKPIADRVIDLADVRSPDVLPLLFGQYLLKGSAHWLTGQTGLGKSTFAYNLGCALAEGNRLWDIDSEPCKVLYVDMESGDVGRALKVERLYRDEPRVRGRLLFLREPVRLPGELPELIDYVQAQGIGLVIFDTARRCFSVKDENDNAEVYRQIIPTLDALKAVGVATLTMGHPSKNGATGARGAGAQEDAGDVNLTLTMHKGEIADKDGVIALRVTKNRLLGLSIPPLYLKRAGDDQFERVPIDEVASAEHPSEETPGAMVRCAADILDHLTDCFAPTRHTDIVKEMVARGHTKSTAKKAIRQLQRDGDIENDGTGYVLSAERNVPVPVPDSNAQNQLVVVEFK